MAEPTINLGGGNWAGKTDNLLGYYKEGERFYKQDFTFSRSTTGTYTDSDGYIQDMPYNLLQYSEDFSQGVYVKNNTSVTSGFTSPNNTNNAFKFVENNANSTHSMYNNVVNGIGDFTISMFAKSAERSKVRITNGTTSRKATFNLSNATISDEAGVSASMVSFGNGWYRCIITYNTTSVNDEYFNINIANNLGDFAYQGDGSSGLYIYGAQLVKGTSAKTYFPTTTRLNMPRVDYLNNSNGSLILEPQRTNAINHSNDYTQWSNTQFTINSNSVTSPEGITNGTKIVPSTSNTDKYLDKGGFSRTSGQYITHTVYAKASGYNFLYLSNSASRLYAVYDLQQGLVIYNNSNGTDFNNHSASIELFGDGWYRCELIGQAQNSFASYFRISCGITAINSSTQGLFQGDGTSGIEVYGSQVELNESYATTLINTSGSSVTRNADACSMTNASDRIGQTEGTLYSEFDLTEDSAFTIIEINLGNSTNNRILAYRNASYIAFIVQVGGVIEINNSTLVTFLDTNKVAVTYKTDEFKIYLNGSLVKTYTSGSIPSGFDTIDLQDNNLQGRKQSIKDLKVYKEILTNSELITLTT